MRNPEIKLQREIKAGCQSCGVTPPLRQPSPLRRQQKVEVCDSRPTFPVSRLLPLPRSPCSLFLTDFMSVFVSNFPRHPSLFIPQWIELFATVGSSQDAPAHN